MLWCPHCIPVSHNTVHVYPSYCHVNDGLRAAMSGGGGGKASSKYTAGGRAGNYFISRTCAKGESKRMVDYCTPTEYTSYNEPLYVPSPAGSEKYTPKDYSPPRPQPRAKPHPPRKCVMCVERSSSILKVRIILCMCILANVMLMIQFRRGLLRLHLPLHTEQGELP